MSLLLAALAVTASCTPSPALDNAGPQQIRAFFEAINAKDEAAIGGYLAPGASFSNPQGAQIPLADVMTMLLASPDAERLNVVEATARGQEVLVRTLTTSGTPAAATVEVRGGCVTRFVQTV